MWYLNAYYAGDLDYRYRPVWIACLSEVVESLQGQAFRPGRHGQRESFAV